MSRKGKGILLIICSAFCFAVMNLFVRMAGDIPSVQKSFFRNLVAVVIALALLIKKKESIRVGKEPSRVLLLRVIFGTVGILCNFYAVDHLIIADASMLNKLSPFFVILLSHFILKEKATMTQFLFVVVAFVGSIFIIKPSFSNAELFPSMIGLAGGLAAGTAYTAVRCLSRWSVSKDVIVFYFSAFSCLVTLPFLIFDFRPMTWMQFLILMMAGLAASGGQFAITMAYTYAPAKEISVYDYSQVIFVALLGIFFLNQYPDVYSTVGYFIICMAAVLSYLYNRKHEKERVMPEE